MPSSDRIPIIGFRSGRTASATQRNGKTRANVRMNRFGAATSVPATNTKRGRTSMRPSPSSSLYCRARLLLAVPPHKLLDTTGRVDVLTTTSVERVVGRVDVRLIRLGAHGRAHFDFRAVGQRYAERFVLGMNVLLHNASPSANNNRRLEPDKIRSLRSEEH